MTNELPLAKKQEIFYAECVKAWLGGRMERDKSLIALSWGGVLAVVGLLATLKVVGIPTLVLTAISLVSFVTTLILVLIVFRDNTIYIGKVLASDAEEQNLEKERLSVSLKRKDFHAMVAFVLGVSSAAIAGILSALQKGI